MNCPQCGAHNRKEAAFCKGCGEKLKPARARRQPAQASGNTGKKALAAGAAVLLIGLAAIVGRVSNSEPSAPAGLQTGTRTFGPEVREIASKFLCSCGTCDVPELADCVCPTAIEEKALIERELELGTPQTQVVELVQRRYGRLKPQYASLVGSAAGEPVASMGEGGAEPDESADGSPRLVESEPLSILATEVDTLAIASRFTCACTQCRDHVLAECFCSHPGGAAEMKAYINYRISQQRHTVDEIVKAVAQEYGHLRDDESVGDRQDSTGLPAFRGGA